jgi:SAM-dependent methyltransferase
LSARAYTLASPRRFASAVASAVNEITRQSPAPRDLPFFGLDHLSELGIFRIYERVLDLSAGLGGPARWLARRRGCRVFSFDPDRERAAASRLLVRRAHLEAAVTVATAPFASLPAPSDAFTHAWSVDALHVEERKRPVFDELFRVVRPGGHVALQEWVRAKQAPALPSGWFDPAEVYAEGLRAAGFLDLRLSDAGDLREEESAITEIVWERVAELLGEPRSGERRPLVAATAVLEERARAVREDRLALVQIFARKPG